MTKLSSSLPIGDGNGLSALAAQLINDPHKIRVVVGFVDCKSMTTDVDTGDVVPTARVRRIEPITGEDARVLERILRRAFEQRTGKAVLPFDLEEDMRAVFDQPDTPTD